MTGADGGSHREWARNAALLAVVLLLCVLAGELAVRLAGYRPWPAPRLQYEVEPGGRLFAPDAELGWANLPGDFSVRMEWQHAFRVRVDPRGRRLTRLPAATAAARPGVWILGGSYTHGWLVQDEESYPWLVQSRLAGHEVVNFGVPGYGTLQSLLQFERVLADGQMAEVVVLAYASFHDIRNTAVRRLRKARLVREADEVTMPSASLAADGSLRIEQRPVDYVPVPGMRLSAFMHLLEETWNRIEVRLTPSHEVTKAIIERLHRGCQEHGIELVIVGLTSHPDTLEMLQYWQARGVTTADISFDAEASPEYRFVPNDNHPSALGHAYYADRLMQVLDSIGVR